MPAITRPTVVYRAGSKRAIEIVRGYAIQERRRRTERAREMAVSRALQDVPGRGSRRRVAQLMRSSYGTSEL
jgi:hypothetical protein